MKLISLLSLILTASMSFAQSFEEIAPPSTEVFVSVRLQPRTKWIKYGDKELSVDDTAIVFANENKKEFELSCGPEKYQIIEWGTDNVAEFKKSSDCLEIGSSIELNSGDEGLSPESQVPLKRKIEVYFMAGKIRGFQIRNTTN